MFIAHFLVQIAHNVSAMVSTGFQRTELSDLHLAKFSILSLISIERKIVNFADFIKCT